jgi:hypothetical protein
MKYTTEIRLTSCIPVSPKVLRQPPIAVHMSQYPLLEVRPVPILVSDMVACDCTWGEVQRQEVQGPHRATL